MLLEPRFLERLERLALAGRERFSGLYPGEHRSRRLGSSVDFADWRPYVEGDDFRRIDYQIYARLDRLLIRMYESEDELLVRVVVDASQSMAFEGKFETAQRLAGALAYLAACRRDRARVWLVDEGGLQAGPWARSRDSALTTLAWLDQKTTRGSADLAAGLHALQASGGMTGLTILVTDLLSENWEDIVRSVGGAGGEAALLHVLSHQEIEPELTGDMLLVDSERDSTVEVSFSEQVGRAYRSRVASWLDQVSTACRQRGIRYSLIDPQVDLESLLLVDLRREGLVR